MIYELYYWPSIQGRGRFLRLTPADANTACRHVARENLPHGGVTTALFATMNDVSVRIPFNEDGLIRPCPELDA